MRWAPLMVPKVLILPTARPPVAKSRESGVGVTPRRARSVPNHSNFCAILAVTGASRPEAPIAGLQVAVSQLNVVVRPGWLDRWRSASMPAAQAHDMVGDAGIEVDRERGRVQRIGPGGGDATEIQIKVLDLAGPIAGETNLGAAAYCEACFCGVTGEARGRSPRAGGAGGGLGRGFPPDCGSGSRLLRGGGRGGGDRGGWARGGGSGGARC